MPTRQVHSVWCGCGGDAQAMQAMMSIVAAASLFGTVAISGAAASLAAPENWVWGATWIEASTVWTGCSAVSPACLVARLIALPAVLGSFSAPRQRCCTRSCAARACGGESIDAAISSRDLVVCWGGCGGRPARNTVAWHGRLKRSVPPRAQAQLVHKAGRLSDICRLLWLLCGWIYRWPCVGPAGRGGRRVTHQALLGWELGGGDCSRRLQVTTTAGACTNRCALEHTHNTHAQTTHHITQHHHHVANNRQQHQVRSCAACGCSSVGRAPGCCSVLSGTPLQMACLSVCVCSVAFLSWGVCGGQLTVQPWHFFQCLIIVTDRQGCNDAPQPPLVLCHSNCGTQHTLACASLGLVRPGCVREQRATRVCRQNSTSFRANRLLSQLVLADCKIHPCLVSDESL